MDLRVNCPHDAEGCDYSGFLTIEAFGKARESTSSITGAASNSFQCAMLEQGKVMRAVKTIALMMQLAVGIAGATVVGSAQAQDYFGHVLPDTMCHAGETVLFACDTKHARKIAACARSANGTPFGDIRYRFGTETRTELEFPTEPQPVSAYASGASMGDGGRGELTFLSLNHARTTYSVYSMVVNPTYQRDGASESNGVLVEKAGKVVANIHYDPQSIPHAGVLVDSQLFGVAVPLATAPLSIFPEFGSPSSQQHVESQPNSVHTVKEFHTVSDYVATLHLPAAWGTYIIEGDLNGDGLMDSVVFATGHVKWQCRSGQIHVLMRTKRNTWMPAASDDLGCDADVDVGVDIKASHLFVTMDAIKGANTSYEFQWRNGVLELVGMRVQYADGGLNDEPFFSADSEFNFRTGIALFKRKVDIAPGMPPLKPDHRPIRVHASGPVCTLDQLTYKFDFCADRWKAAGTTVADLMLVK